MSSRMMQTTVASAGRMQLETHTINALRRFETLLLRKQTSFGISAVEVLGKGDI